MKLLGKACAVLAAAGLCATALSAPDAGAGSGLVADAARLQAESRVHVRDVLHLQELARKQKDVIKLNCVNEMLVQIKPQMNLLEDAKANLPTATDQTVTFGTVQKAADSIRQLAEQAAQCLGEPELGNESSNSFSHPFVPDDPFQGPEPWGNGGTVEPPGYASPFT